MVMASSARPRDCLALNVVTTRSAKVTTLPSSWGVGGLVGVGMGMVVGGRGDRQRDR